MKARTTSGAITQWNEVGLFDSDEFVEDHNAGSLAQVQEVFEFWVDTLWNGKGVRPLLSDKRRKKIVGAIKLYGVPTCLQAITGCSKSDFHMGNNAEGKKYTDLELILRDPEHIERFVSYNEEDEF